MSFPKRTVRRVQGGQCVVSTKDNVSFPKKTMCRFHRGQCVVSTKDNVWLPHRTMCGFHTGQCVVSKQDNVSCPSKTMCASQTGQCMLPKQEKSKDGSDFHDFLTKTIAAPSKQISHQRKNRGERTTKQRRTKKFTGGCFATNLFVGYKI